LKRGYLDPFTQKDLRKNLLAALAEASRDGVVVKSDKGVYALPNASDVIADAEVDADTD
jgi:monomeric isocitrate dehydrogenase